MQHAGQVAHHALQLHVVGFGGGFHVAVDVDLDGAIVPARDGHGGIAAFDGVQNFARARVQRHAASISDEFAGDRREVGGEPGRQHDAGGQRGGDRRSNAARAR